MGDTKTDSSILHDDIAAGLKAAMRRMPSAVALITTRDPDSGAPAGLAASAVIPVSMEPASMLISINRSATAHSVIERAGQFCINLLGTAQSGLVKPFSSSALRNERFTGADWDLDSPLPFLSGACANIFCTVRTTLLFGTHELFIGEVSEVRTNGEGDPLGWIEGSFAQLGRLAVGD